MFDKRQKSVTSIYVRKGIAIPYIAAEEGNFQITSYLTTATPRKLQNDLAHKTNLSLPSAYGDHQGLLPPKAEFPVMSP